MSSGPTVDIATGMPGSQIDMNQTVSDITARENEERIAEELSKLSKDDSYVVTDSLRNHIENAEPVTSGRAGVKGAHNKQNFLTAINNIGAHITGTVPNSQLPGVEKIYYKMPKKDAKGNPTGEYQAKTWSKTVYDPGKISTDDYLKWGLQAANNAARQSSTGKIGREWTGTDNQGIHWHGYCSSDGEITSFYPED